MRCLSMLQPWNWAVLHGGKLIENRKWKTFFRGPILLHASKGCTKAYVDEATIWMREHIGVGVCASLALAGPLPRGGIVGRARIVDVIPKGGLPPTFLAPRHPGLDLRWHMPDQYGFVLADVEPLPFVPWPGSLGLFTVPDDYATRAPPGRLPRERVARTP